MSSKIIAINIIIIIAATVYFGCDAPRENPLDPNNPDSKLGAITGTVRTNQIPSMPIENVSVFWRKEGILTQTDANGSYAIEDIKPQNGFLFFEKEGFRTDSFSVAWSNKKVFTYDVTLNTLPVLDSIALYTVIENRYSLDPLVSLIFKTKVSEFDIIRSVLVKNDLLEFSRELDYNVSTKMYEKTIKKLNVDYVEQMVGFMFDIVVIDRYGDTTIVGKENIKRLIKSEIRFDSPARYDSVYTRTPTFVWKKFEPGFNFTYELNIYINQPNPELVWSKDSIPMETFSYEIDEPLPLYDSPVDSTYDFFWVLWVVDNFNNKASSKPASFKYIATK